MKVYISGPMRGLPKFNFPAFDEAAAVLRSEGHEVFNPADNDRERGFDCDRMDDVPPAELREMLAWDCARILESDFVVLLPGWMLSRGALLEAHLALVAGIPCELYGKATVRVSLNPSFLAATIAQRLEIAEGRR